MAYNKYFYDIPTQVKFLDIYDGNEKHNWSYGIAYHDEIICLCCGAIIDIQEFFDESKEYEECPIRATVKWFPLNLKDKF